MKGNKDAIKIHEEIVSNSPVKKYAWLGLAYINSGREKEGKEILKDLETIYDTIPSSWGALKRAQMYAGLGDYENAFKWYNFEPHHHFVPWVRVRVNYDSLFIDYPGFKKLMRRCNLPDPAPFQYDPDLNP